MVFWLDWGITCFLDILKTLYYTTLFLIQEWHTSHGLKSSKQSPKNNKFQGRKTSKCTSIHWDKIILVSILNLTDIITLNNCMLVFDHVKSSLPAIFDDLFKPLKNNIVTLPEEQEDMF